MDVTNNFYWVSTRNYPESYENYQSGIFNNGTVTNVQPVIGNFYIEEPGWIIMDAEISPDGQLLFFVNAKFEGGSLPVTADIGVAHNVNGEFIKDDTSDILFDNVNTDRFLEYAPSFSANGLELFFTRIINSKTAIFITNRTSLNEPFGTGKLILSKDFLQKHPH